MSVRFFLHTGWHLENDIQCKGCGERVRADMGRGKAPRRCDSDSGGRLACI